MLKATVNDGPEQLWLEQEISKAGAVDGDVGALDVFLGGSFGPICPGGRLHLIVFIIQELIVHIVLCHNWAGRGRREVSELGVPEQVRKRREREGLKNSKGKDTSFRQKSWERGQQQQKRKPEKLISRERILVHPYTPIFPKPLSRKEGNKETHDIKKTEHQMGETESDLHC